MYPSVPEDDERQGSAIAKNTIQPSTNHHHHHSTATRREPNSDTELVIRYDGDEQFYACDYSVFAEHELLQVIEIQPEWAVGRMISQRFETVSSGDESWWERGCILSHKDGNYAVPMIMKIIKLKMMTILFVIQSHWNWIQNIVITTYVFTNFSFSSSNSTSVMENTPAQVMKNEKGVRGKRTELSKINQAKRRKLCNKEKKGARKAVQALEAEQKTELSRVRRENHVLKGVLESTRKRLPNTNKTFKSTGLSYTTSRSTFGRTEAKKN